MSNLEDVLKSYSGSDQQSYMESLFSRTFDHRIRMIINGRSYKRNFIIYQNRMNFARELQVENIVMEFLDHNSFHYTFQVVNCCSTNDRHLDNQTHTFHAFATVERGKILTIKPMTGLLYIRLFEGNINYEMDERDKEDSTVQQEHFSSTPTNTLPTKKYMALASPLPMWTTLSKLLSSPRNCTKNLWPKALPTTQ